MRLREAGGSIAKARNVYLYVPYAQTQKQCEPAESEQRATSEVQTHGVWLLVPKTQARTVISAAKDDGLEEVEAHWDGPSDFMIGVE